MSKLSFRARALDASKPMPIYLAEDLPDLPDYTAINRAVPQMPSGMEKEEESEHHLQRAICTGLIIPTPEVAEAPDLEFYERCYPPDYKMPKQLIHMQPLCLEQEAPEYDIDSEDEKWLKQHRYPDLTDVKFEEMMDKLERSSGQTVVTLKEATLLLERHDEVVVAVFDYWLNKRLKTQHPLILSVKTESRLGQPANNPYLAFRRRTEKMQTRKNRKNDESSYEKMVKLRRELGRAAALLDMVARRERVKRDACKLSAQIAEKRYRLGDYAGHVLAEVAQSAPARVALTPLPLPLAQYRRDAYATPAYAHAARTPPSPQHAPPQREKRQYKRRKHRHHPASAQATREAGPYSSSEEERGVEAAAAAVAAALPHDDGPFAFRRKPGAVYLQPTSTLHGDFEDESGRVDTATPVHERDERYRYTLTSLAEPYKRCIGFARRRVGRGGRLVIDRISTPLDDLWPELDFTFRSSSEYKQQRKEEEDLELRPHRHPMEISRDFQSTKKYPWRRAFRRHLAKNPSLWVKEEEKPMVENFLTDSFKEVLKKETEESVFGVSAVTDKVNNSDIGLKLKSDTSFKLDVNRKRRKSGCSDGYDSEGSLDPAEKEFSGFLDEVNREWLHYRPKTPPAALRKNEDGENIEIDSSTKLSVDLHFGQPIRPELPSAGMSDDLTPFRTTEFSLQDLYGLGASLEPEPTKSSNSLLINNQCKDHVDRLQNEADPFLFKGQSTVGASPAGSGRENFGSSTVKVVSAHRKLTIEKPEPAVTIVKPVVEAKPARPIKPPDKPKPVERPKPVDKPKIIEKPKPEPKVDPQPEPVPTSNVIIEEVNEVPIIKEPVVQKKREVEEIQLAHGVQLKTVQTKNSPLKKHIITAQRRPDVSLSASEQQTQPAAVTAPQIVTVAVSESLKMRLQSHLLGAQQQSLVLEGMQSGGVVGLVQNGPYAVSNAGPVAVVPASVAVPVTRDGTTVGVSVSVSASTSAARRVTAPIVHLAPTNLQSKLLAQQAPLVVHSHALQPQPQPSKLKVLQAHALTQSQRQLLQRGATLAQLPAVVSLSTLADGKQQLLKSAPVAQYFEIKSGQLGKPHLVNVVRQPQPAKVARLDLSDAKKRQVVATLEGGAKGAVGAGVTAARHRLGAPLVRASVPVRAQHVQHVRHQLALRQGAHGAHAAAPPVQLPSAVVANLLHKGQKISLGGVGAGGVGVGAGGALASVQYALSAAQQMKARQARLVAQPRTNTVTGEMVESGATAGPSGAGGKAADGDAPDPSTNGAVRRRAQDTLPMEVT